MTDTDQSLDPLNDKFHGDIEAFRSYYQWDASRPTNFGFPDSVDVVTEAAKLGTPDPDQNAHPGAYLSGGPFVPPVVPPPARLTSYSVHTSPPALDAPTTLRVEVTSTATQAPLEHAVWFRTELDKLIAEFHRLFHSS